MSLEQFMEAEASMSRSAGHCMVMGTASTMASMVESLGTWLSLQRGRCPPSIRAVMRSPTSPAAASSTLIRDDVRISKILTRAAFENAIRVNGAIGGSTNAVIHLLAIAGRVGVPLSLRGLGRPRHGTCRRSST